MNGTLADIPTMDQVIAEPSRAATLPPEVAQAFLIGFASVHPLLIVQALKDTSKADSPSTPERWLTVEEAADLFKVTPRWLKKNKKNLPHSQPSRKTLLFDEVRLRKWFAAHKAN